MLFLYYTRSKAYPLNARQSIAKSGSKWQTLNSSISYLNNLKCVLISCDPRFLFFPQWWKLTSDNSSSFTGSNTCILYDNSFVSKAYLTKKGIPNHKGVWHKLVLSELENCFSVVLKVGSWQSLLWIYPVAGMCSCLLSSTHRNRREHMV